MKAAVIALLIALIGVSSWFWYDHRALEDRLSHSTYNPCLVTAPDGTKVLITDCTATSTDNRN